jgi:hypothetical protein
MLELSVESSCDLGELSLWSVLLRYCGFFTEYDTEDQDSVIILFYFLIARSLFSPLNAASSTMPSMNISFMSL